MSLINLIEQNEPTLSLVDFDENQILVMPDTDVEGWQFAVWVYTTDGDLMDADDFADMYDLDDSYIRWIVLTPPVFVGTYHEWVSYIKDWLEQL